MPLGFAELCLLSCRKFVDVPVDVLDCAVLCNQFSGSYFAYALDSWHIIRCIAAKCKHFNDLRRIVNAVFLADCLDIHDFVGASGFSRLDLEDVFFDELAVVLVRRDHIDLFAGCSLTFCHRADDVVRLESGHHQHRYFQCSADSRERFKSINDKLRCSGPGRLVFRIHDISERPSRRVECNCQIFRMFSIYQFQNVFSESEKDGHVRPFRIDHGTAQKCIVHLEYQRMSIDQI